MDGPAADGERRIAVLHTNGVDPSNLSGIAEATYQAKSTLGGKRMNKKVLTTLTSFGIASGLLVAAMCGTAIATVAPEIDPGSASGGLALLAGLILLLGQRLRRRQR
jgi:hypothetical protein